MDDFRNKLLSVLFGVYCSCLMIQNVLAAKTVDIAIFTVTTGVLVSPFVFIVQDVTSELFGFQKAKKMILLSFLMNFIAALLFQAAIALPASASFMNQAAFATTLGSTLRITCASFAAYLTGSILNAKIMIMMKEKYGGSLFVRAISSTVVGQLFDNAIFAFGAFAFILPVPAILSMIVGGTLFEVIYEILFYPITKKVIKTLETKMVEGGQ